MNRKAFTLIELSVVIIVISLIIAGMMLAQDMFRRSKVRSVINESTKYITAINSFKYQYGYYPGDIPNASTVISSSLGNGNGNFFIEYPIETWNSWIHLAAAGLIESTYNYSITEPSSSYNPNTIWRMESPGSATYNIQASTINTFGMAGCGLNHTNTCDMPSPIDSYEIDTKMDDGNPATGKIITLVNGTGCVKNLSGSYVYSSAYTNTDVVYNLLNSSLLCSRIIFVI